MYKAGIETKTKIINAAKYLFYENGYYNTTIKDITDRAKIRRTLFFYYFENKYALAAEIYQNLQDTHFELIHKQIKNIKLNNLERICLEVISQHRLILNDKKLSRFVSEISIDGILMTNDYIKNEFYKLIKEYPHVTKKIPADYIIIQNLALSAMIFKLNARTASQRSIEELIHLKLDTFLHNLYFEEAKITMLKKKVLDIEKTLHFIIVPYFEVKLYNAPKK